jgi:hypothetical protein
MLTCWVVLTPVTAKRLAYVQNFKQEKAESLEEEEGRGGYRSMSLALNKNIKSLDQTVVLVTHFNGIRKRIRSCKRS